MKSYTRPELIEYGTVAELTLGSCGGTFDVNVITDARGTIAGITGISSGNGNMSGVNQSGTTVIPGFSCSS